VTTWTQANPKHQSLKCFAGNHLWKQALAYAIYNKAGELTKGGEEPRTFSCNKETLREFFGASKNGVDKAIKFLLKHGWLKATAKKKHLKYVSHEKWAETFPGKCVERNLLPHQEEADPFVGELYAVAQTDLRLQPHWLASVRQCASDIEILSAFTEQRRADIARKLAGDGHMTSAKNSFYVVCDRLKRQHRERLRAERKAAEI